MSIDELTNKSKCPVDFQGLEKRKHVILHILHTHYTCDFH